jgi:hypothetical protein
VMNNPLSLVDPSGFSWFSKAWKKVTHFFKKYWREIAAIAVALYTGYYFGNLGWMTQAQSMIAAGAAAGATYAAVVTALYGGSMGDVLRNGLIGGALGAIAGWSNFMSLPPVGGVLAGAAVGTPSGSPPMTAPTGAVSLTIGAAVKEFFNTVKGWFSQSSLPTVYPQWEDETDKNKVDPFGTPMYQKVNTAISTAIDYERERLPPMRGGLLVMFWWGGSDEYADAAWDEYQQQGRINLIGANYKYTISQTEANSNALHELMHVRFEAAGKLTVDQQHALIYRVQWDLRNDQRFLLVKGRDYRSHVLDECQKYKAGCVDD